MTFAVKVRAGEARKVSTVVDLPGATVTWLGLGFTLVETEHAAVFAQPHLGGMTGLRGTLL